MKEQILNFIIIILASIATGMIFGLLVKKNKIYHGPNAKKQSREIYFHHPTKKCIKFAVKPITC